jgi:hypothetical protein
VLWPPCTIAVARRASARGANTDRSNELLDVTTVIPASVIAEVPALDEVRK